MSTLKTENVLVKFTPQMSVSRLNFHVDSEDPDPKPVHVALKGFDFDPENEDFDGQIIVCRAFGVVKWRIWLDNDHPNSGIQFTDVTDNAITLTEQTIFDCLIVRAADPAHLPTLHTPDTLVHAFGERSHCKVPDSVVRAFYDRTFQNKGKVLDLGEMFYEVQAYARTEAALVNQAIAK